MVSRIQRWKGVRLGEVRRERKRTLGGIREG